MRQKYVELVKNFISKKPEYKETLDEIKQDTQIVGATEEEFEQAIKEIESTPQEIKNEVGGSKVVKVIKSRPRAFKIAVAVLLMFFLIPSFVIVYNDNFSKQEAITSVPREESIVKNIKKETVRVVYANSTPIDVSKVFSVNPDRVVLAVTGKPKKEVLGFFPYWMMENWDKVNFGALTSVALFGLEVNGNGEIVTRSDDGKIDPGWDMWQNPNLPSLIRRTRNNNLKVYLTFKSFSNENIEALSNSDDSQQRFVANASYLVSSRNLDGVNIDFEATRGFDQKTRDGFTRLIKNLATELKKQNPNAQVSIDTYLVSGAEQSGLFDLPKLAANTDAFVIMGYDMHTLKGDPGPVAAMGGNANIIGYVQNYLEKIPASKIILAVPYYGYDWPANKDSAESKAIPYAILAENLKKNSLLWDENSQTPYYNYSDGEVSRIVHFDNVRSLGIKYDYINNKNLKGVGIWALGYDGNNTDLQKLLIDKFIN